MHYCLAVNLSGLMFQFIFLSFDVDVVDVVPVFLTL